MDGMQAPQTNGHETENPSAAAEISASLAPAEELTPAENRTLAPEGAVPGDNSALLMDDSAPVVVDAEDQAVESSILAYPVVGIGASAGGLGG